MCVGVWVGVREREREEGKRERERQESKIESMSSLSTHLLNTFCLIEISIDRSATT